MSNDQVLERKTYSIGASVFKQGDIGDRAYVVQSGKVEVFRVDGGGKETILGTHGKGAFFGEMALLDNAPRMAGVRAIEPTTLIVITRQNFEEKMKQADPFLRGLIHVLAATIREMAAKG